MAKPAVLILEFFKLVEHDLGGRAVEVNPQPGNFQGSPMIFDKLPGTLVGGLRE